MNTCPIKPMRPGLTFRPFDEHPEDIPEGEWTIQYKLDDERAILTPDGQLWNRFGAPYAKEKAVLFKEHAREAGELFSGITLDCALVGIRRPSQPRRLVVLDLLGVGSLDFGQRLSFIRGVTEGADWDPPLNEGRTKVCYLEDYSLGLHRILLRLARSNPHLEGIIGRRAGKPYQQGTSNDMFRCRVR